MPFTSGVFANVAGATSAASGQTIQSAVWNAIHADYSTALNQISTQVAGFTSFKNIMWMNGGLEVWQRGTSVAVTASTTVYTADRWSLVAGANQASTISQQIGLTDQSQFCARVQRNSGQTGTTQMIFGYPLDTDEIIKLRGKFAFFRCVIRAGANWSPASGNITIELAYGTGAGPTQRASFSGLVQVINQTIALTTVSQGVAIISTTIPITATQIQMSFLWTPVGTAGVNDYFEVDDVEIVAIPSAVTADYLLDSFERLPFDRMLDGCKRHYQKSFSYEIAPASGNGIADSIKFYAQAAETFGFWVVHIPELRTTAAFTKYHPTTATSSNWFNLQTGASSSATFATFTSAESTKGVLIIASASVSNTANVMAIHYAASAGIT